MISQRRGPAAFGARRRVVLDSESDDVELEDLTTTPGASTSGAIPTPSPSAHTGVSKDNSSPSSPSGSDSSNSTIRANTPLPAIGRSERVTDSITPSLDE